MEGLELKLTKLVLDNEENSSLINSSADSSQDDSQEKSQNKEEEAPMNVDENHNIVKFSKPDEIQHDSVEKALQNDLILREIQKNLTHVDHILDFRSVSRQWYNNVSPSTIPRQCQDRELRFVYLSSTNIFRQVDRSREFTLLRFNESFRKCDNFPFSRFYFSQGTLSSPDVKEFLSWYGEHVKTLRLRIRLSKDEDSSITKSIGNFRRLVLQDAPNVEHLIIEGTDSTWNTSYRKLFRSPQRLLELPKLKKITLGAESVSEPFFRELVNVAPNLEGIYEVSSTSLNKIMTHEPGKIGAVKGLVMCHLYDETEVMIHARYSELNPKLESISIYYDDVFECLDEDQREALGTIITKILESSQDTLEEVKLCPFSFVSTMKLPIFDKVQRITLRDSATYWDDEEIVDRNFFPVGIKMADIFPNVVRIEFDLRTFNCHDVSHWSEIVSPGDCLPSVKSLIMYDVNENTPHWFCHLSKLLPNLDHFEMITFRGNEAAPGICTGIWKYFPRIKTVKIQIRLCKYTRHFCAAMDSAFVGISSEKCVHLIKDMENGFTVDVDKYREEPSIMDLKDLKMLSLEFDVRFAWESNVFPIFSKLTAIGFQNIKQRQNVTINISNFRPLPIEKIDTLKSVLQPVLDVVDDFKPCYFHED